jgi:hypothetical protein
MGSVVLRGCAWLKFGLRRAQGRKLTVFARQIFSQSHIHLAFSKNHFQFVAASDFSASVEGSVARIFLLTSLFIDSKFQTVATDDRCESMNNGKGE